MNHKGNNFFFVEYQNLQTKFEEVNVYNSKLNHSTTLLNEEGLRNQLEVTYNVLRFIFLITKYFDTDKNNYVCRSKTTKF